MDAAELSKPAVAASSTGPPTTSFSATTKKWTKWASGFFKREKPLGSEPWFNPEADTKQKREWLEQQQSQAGTGASWPEHIYEKFYVLGLPPDMEITQIAEQLCELERKQRHHHDSDADSDHGRDYIQPPQPSLAPQVLFSFPAGSAAPISDEEVAALAFPTGVAPEKLKRTPSLSALDELIMGRDSDAQQQCFVFMLKVGGNFPLYGCCWYVREMLHRPPYLARQRHRNCKAPFRQCMIAAPRCYCLLTHYPFFELHFRVLKIILDLERLERLLEYDTEKSKLPMPLIMPAPSLPARSSLGSRHSGSADAASTGRSRTPSQRGVEPATGQHGPLASHSSAATADGLPGLPVVHNRESYCAECAGIIEDMLPFTPGQSPVPFAAPWQQHSKQQVVQQHHPQPSPQKRQPLQPPAVQQQQQASDQYIERSQQQQQVQQQQQGGPAQAARCGVCEVCGKPLGAPEPDHAVSTPPGMSAGNGISQVSSSTAAGSAGSILGMQELMDRHASAAAAGTAAAALGPLEAALLQHQHQQQAKQQHHEHVRHSGASRFAAAKSYVAAAGADGGSQPSLSHQDGFDAVAASLANFDSAAAAAAGDGSSSSRVSSTAPNGEDRWGHLQHVVAAIRGAASAPMVESSESSAGHTEDCMPASVSEPVPQQQEASLVQRMWDVWAPRTSVATPSETPRTSSIASLFRRASRPSITQIPAQPEQQEMLPLPQQQSPQLQEGTAAWQEQQQQQKGLHLHQLQDLDAAGHPEVAAGDVGKQIQAAPTVTADARVADAAATNVWAEDPDLRPLRSFKAVSSSATSLHSSHQPTDEAAPAEAHSAEEAPGMLAPAAATADAPVADSSGQRAAVTAAEPAGPGSGGAVLAARAVHRHTPSGASNASSFYSAIEHLEAESGTESADVKALMQPSVPTLMTLTESIQHQLGPLDEVVQGTQPVQLQQSQQQQAQDSMTQEQRQQSSPDQSSTLEHRRSSGRQSSPDSEKLVSAFAAIAATASPFPAVAASDSSSPMPHDAAGSGNVRMQSSPRRVGSAGPLPLPSSAEDTAVSVHSSIDATRSTSCSAVELAQASGDSSSTDANQLEHARSQPSNGSGGLISPASGQLGQQQQTVEQQASVQSQPVSRGSSVKRSQMFEEVALRRSGEMSVELCKTISHLVQVDSTSLLSAYHSSPVPVPGEVYRLMLGDLYRLEFERVLPQPQYTPPGRSRLQHQVLSYAEVECAQQLQLWTVAALCRSLSLENIITVLNAVLLEKQLVIFCPHIGTLAAIVLSLVPLLRPFSWQSLMLPVTPISMMGFLEAPVPFVLGVQYKTPGVVSRCHGLMRVNVYKDGIKNASFPSLPNSRQLLHALAPHHSALCEAAPLAVERPVHVITPDEEAAASNFLSVLHGYLSQLCGDLRLHTIVNVGMTKRTGVFMKDSLIDSQQPKDRPFMKAFVETQMFAVYADGVISDYCES